MIDDERNILYSRTHESKIQGFDLGEAGDSAPKKVAEERNLWVSIGMEALEGDLHLVLTSLQ